MFQNRPHPVRDRRVLSLLKREGRPMTCFEVGATLKCRHGLDVFDSLDRLTDKGLIVQCERDGTLECWALER